MSLTIEQARNEILTAFKTRWDLITPPIPPVQWPDMATDDFAPPTDKAWARVTLAHASGGQATLAGQIGQRRFRRGGTVAVQIFTPVGGGATLSYTLSQVVMDAFEGVATPGGVWFRNVRVNEIGPDGHWWQVNVLADFTYDQVK